MKLLLDTHVWVWSHLSPERIAAPAAHALRNPRHELWLSPVSVWELLILVERGRVSLDRPAEEWVREALKQVPLNEAPLTHEIAIESRKIDLPHQDPADRFLVATARVLGLVLMTSDDRLIRAKPCAILENR